MSSYRCRQSCQTEPNGSTAMRAISQAALASWEGSSRVHTDMYHGLSGYRMSQPVAHMYINVSLEGSGFPDDMISIHTLADVLVTHD